MGVKLQYNSPMHMMSMHRRKHFMPLHKQEKKVFIFPNATRDTFYLPDGYDICMDLESFKIKSLKGGFQRRPELIAQCGIDKNHGFNSINTQEFPNPKAVHIQLELTEKALQLIDLFQPSVHQQSNWTDESEISARNRHLPKFALDIGCGTGISMIPLINSSHICIGVDLNMQSLTHLRSKGQMYMHQNPAMPSSLLSGTFSFSEKFDIIRWDLRHGLPFRENTFDLSISISFLQWLFYGHRHKQLQLFFSSLHKVLRPGGICVVQFYPRNLHQLSYAVNHAALYFKGALVGDYPHVDRGRKLFLLLYK